MIGNPNLLHDLLEGERCELSALFVGDNALRDRVFVSLVEFALDLKSPNDVIDLALSRADSIAALSAIDLVGPGTEESTAAETQYAQNKSTKLDSEHEVIPHEEDPQAGSDCEVAMGPGCPPEEPSDGLSDGLRWVWETDLYLSGPQTCLRDIQAVVITKNAGLPMPMVIQDNFGGRVRKFLVGDILYGMEDEKYNTCMLERIIEDESSSKRFARFISLFDDINISLIDFFDIVASANADKMELNCQSRRVQLRGEIPPDDKGRHVKLIMQNHRHNYNIPYERPDVTVWRDLVRAGTKKTKMRTIGIKDTKMEIEMIARFKSPVDLRYTLSAWNKRPPPETDDDDDSGYDSDGGSDGGGGGGGRNRGDESSDDDSDNNGRWIGRYIEDGVLRPIGAKRPGRGTTRSGGLILAKGKRKQPTTSSKPRQKLKLTLKTSTDAASNGRADSPMFFPEDDTARQSRDRRQSPSTEQIPIDPDLEGNRAGTAADGTSEYFDMTAGLESYLESVLKGNKDQAVS